MSAALGSMRTSIFFWLEPLGQHRGSSAVVDLRGCIQFARHRWRSRRGRGRSGGNSSSRCDHLLACSAFVARDAGQALYQFFDKKYRAIDRTGLAQRPSGVWVCTGFGIRRRSRIGLQR